MDFSLGKTLYTPCYGVCCFYIYYFQLLKDLVISLSVFFCFTKCSCHMPFFYIFFQETMRVVPGIPEGKRKAKGNMAEVSGSRRNKCRMEIME